MAVDERRRARRGRLLVAGMVIAGGLGFLVSRGLDNATLYFRTADEAVAQRESLGDRRFRLEGTVVEGSVRSRGALVDFTVEEGGASVDVVHEGDPPELFREGLPVVLEGRWDGDHFSSDRIMVRHTSEYRAEYPDRVAPGQD